MKTYYLYAHEEGARLRFIEAFEAEDDKDVRRYIKKNHPGLTGWDALRKKYVANKLTGELRLRPKEKP